MGISFYQGGALMTNLYIEIIRLKNNGDERGFSYKTRREAFDYIGKVEDVHIASIDSGKIRGNHYHIDRKECIIILYSDSWVFAWESEDVSVGEKKQFSGCGCILIKIKSNVTHAIQNIGKLPIYILAFSPNKYDPEKSDTVVKKII
ncbi:MAG: polysaccharide biosynthesis C-terminal domain-containing protein [Planctomycetota bacterium]